jgi:hypothetical protein
VTVQPFFRLTAMPCHALPYRNHDPCVDGLFLVRKSTKDKGFVLSLILGDDLQLVRLYIHF